MTPAAKTAQSSAVIPTVPAKAETAAAQTGSANPAIPASAGGQAPATMPPVNGPSDTGAPAATQSPATPAVPQATVLSFSPGTVTTTAGQTFMVDVVVSAAQDLFTVPVQIQYDPTMLQVVNVSNGGFLGQGDQAVALAQRDDAANGMVQVTATRPPNSGGVSGQGSVFTLTFMAKESGSAIVAITRAGLRSVTNQPITVAGTQAAVVIKERPQAAAKTN